MRVKPDAQAGGDGCGISAAPSRSTSTRVLGIISVQLIQPLLLIQAIACRTEPILVCDRASALQTGVGGLRFRGSAAHEA